MSRSMRQVELLPATEYQQITVKMHHAGVVLLGVKLGSEIKAQRQYIAQPGQVIVSRIDARNGAIGVVPDDLAGAVVSNDFWLFDVDQAAINREYLGYVVASPEFTQQCIEASEGSTNRVRLQPAKFLELQIPVPPRDIQQRLATALNGIAAAIDDCLREREVAEDKTTALVRSLAHRADLDPAQKIRDGWKEFYLGDLMRPSEDRITVKSTEQYPNLGIYSFGRGLFHKPPIVGALSSAGYLSRVKEGQFIYSRLFAFEGGYAVVKGDFDGTYVSNEFPSFDVDPSVARPEFLWAYFQEPGVWESIAAMSVGLGDRRRRVHPQQLLQHRVMVPPLTRQETIRECTFPLERLRDIQAATLSRLQMVVTSTLSQIFPRATRVA